MQPPPLAVTITTWRDPAHVNPTYKHLAKEWADSLDRYGQDWVEDALDASCDKVPKLGNSHSQKHVFRFSPAHPFGEIRLDAPNYVFVHLREGRWHVCSAIFNYERDCKDYLGWKSCLKHGKVPRGVYLPETYPLEQRKPFPRLVPHAAVPAAAPAAVAQLVIPSTPPSRGKRTVAESSAVSDEKLARELFM